MDWYKDLKIDDIPPGIMQEVACTNGIFDAISLMRHVPGLQLYIPVYGKKKIQSDYVTEHYNGKNLLSLSVKIKMASKKVLHLIKRNGNYTRPPASNNYMQIVVKRCGEDVAIRLINNFAGGRIYIPLTGYSTLRQSRIIKEFNGSNTTFLALKYSVSERWIRKIISTHYHNRQAVQLDLFQKNA